MFHIFKKFVMIVVTASLVAPFPAMSAGGLGGGSTEITQLANNVQLIQQHAQALLAYKKQIEQFLTQLQQYRAQLTNMINVNSIAKNLGLQGLANDLSKVNETKKAFEKLYGSMDRLSINWQQRFLEASTANLSLEQYAKREIERIKLGSDSAIKRVEQERRLIDSVEEDYSLAKQWGDQIDNQPGLNSSLGLLNTQMNRMLQQNARINQILAQAHGSDKAVEEQRKAESQARTLKFLEDQAASQRNAYDDITRDFIRPKTSDANRDSSRLGK